MIFKKGKLLHDGFCHFDKIFFPSIRQNVRISGRNYEQKKCEGKILVYKSAIGGE